MPAAAQKNGADAFLPVGSLLLRSSCTEQGWHTPFSRLLNIVAAGLWEQAGMQAKVPVSAVKAEPQVRLCHPASAPAHACLSSLGRLLSAV